MNNDLSLFLKGLAMGAANVIPGVSGGTIALITGIFERLINALKSCDLTALRHLLSRDLHKFWRHIDGHFLSVLLAGVATSIISLARLFEYLLTNHERYTMAFFFGLIILSLYYVSKRITNWSVTIWGALLMGSVVAISIALLAPASQNTSFWYVFLCGVVAISSMILPGLSGSFVLIIMGNYALVLGAISALSFDILLPLALGCLVGLIVFSHLLAWVFKHYKNQTLALMTGFVLGSLVVIWPWKTAITQLIVHDGKPSREVVASYQWFAPNVQDPETWIALLLIAAGAAAIALMEYLAGDQASASINDQETNY